MMITSLNNSRVKRIVQLQEKAKVREKEDAFIIEGTKLFQEAPEESIREIYAAAEFMKKLPPQGDLFKKITRYNIEIVADDVFGKMSDTRTPQGILCVMKKYNYTLDRFWDLAVRIREGGVPGQGALFLILEDLQDPGNVGTIIRTAEAAGVSGVIMSTHTADIYNPKTIRSTMGSLFRVPFVYAADLKGAVAGLQAVGVKVYAAHLAGRIFYDECDYRGASAFLIGNEGNGLSHEITDMADALIRIPMEGRGESLNAGAAAAVLMYEALRQHRNIK